MNSIFHVLKMFVKYNLMGSLMVTVTVMAVFFHFSIIIRHTERQRFSQQDRKNRYLKYFCFKATLSGMTEILVTEALKK